LQVSIVRIEFRHSSKLLQRSFVICLPPESDPQHHVCRSKPRIDDDRAPKM